MFHILPSSQFGDVSGDRIQICSPWIKQVWNLPMTIFFFYRNTSWHSLMDSVLRGLSDRVLPMWLPQQCRNLFLLGLVWNLLTIFLWYIGRNYNKRWALCLLFFSLLLEIALECLYGNALCHSWSIKSGENGVIIRMARRRSKHMRVDTNRPPEHFCQVIYQGFHELMDRQFYT